MQQEKEQENHIKHRTAVKNTILPSFIASLTRHINPEAPILRNQEFSQSTLMNSLKSIFFGRGPNSYKSASVRCLNIRADSGLVKWSVALLTLKSIYIYHQRQVSFERQVSSNDTCLCIGPMFVNQCCTRLQLVFIN